MKVRVKGTSKIRIFTRRIDKEMFRGCFVRKDGTFSEYFYGPSKQIAADRAREAMEIDDAR